jgi:hypothetical protein
MDDHRFRMIEEIRALTNVQEFDNLSMRVCRYLDKRNRRDLDILLTHIGWN